MRPVVSLFLAGMVVGLLGCTQPVVQKPTKVVTKSVTADVGGTEAAKPTDAKPTEPAKIVPPAATKPIEKPPEKPAEKPPEKPPEKPADKAGEKTPPATPPK